MKFLCLCGEPLSNAGQPNRLEHVLIDSIELEKLRDFVDSHSTKSESVIDDWWEDWIDNSATDVWKCHSCNRLYVEAKKGFENVVVYKVEQIGID